MLVTTVAILMQMAAPLVQHPEIIMVDIVLVQVGTPTFKVVCNV